MTKYRELMINTAKSWEDKNYIKREAYLEELGNKPVETGKVENELLQASNFMKMLRGEE